MDISVIFSTYRRLDTLTRTMESLCQLNDNGLHWEVIVVDNAGDAATQQLIKNYSSKLPLTCIVETKPGKNNALNSAIEIASGELFVFTDDDIIADQNWLQEMWKGTQRWPDYMVFGGKILPKFPAGKVPIDQLHPFFNGAYVVANWDIPEGEYDSFLVWGPNMAIRSAVFMQGYRFNTDIGPSGTNYIMGSETELTFRLKYAGMGSIYLPNSFVYHQIRLEQLQVNWLYGRAFRYGRSQAHANELPAQVVRIFNAPRFLIRKLFTLVFKRIIYCFSTNKKYDYGIQYWMLRGNIHQYRKGAK